MDKTWQKSAAISRQQVPPAPDICLKELQNYVLGKYGELPPNHCMRPPKSYFKEGGNDPLDYIYIYRNEEDKGVPAHWHYIGFGLSDIYGYGNACHVDKYIREDNPDYAKVVEPLIDIYPDRSKIEIDRMISGFGFELTMRVASYSLDEGPPMWPGKLMQALASFVFQSKNVFNDGDHTAWVCPLDGNPDSRIQHLLMTLDPQLQETKTSLGKVKFIQLVGVCDEELQAAREWQTRGVLNMMRQRPDTGGKYLVTDMTRVASMFQLDPGFQRLVENGIKESGSGMIAFSCNHKYSAEKPYWLKAKPIDDSDEFRSDNDQTMMPVNQIAGVERGNFLTMSRDDSIQKPQDSNYLYDRNPSRMSCGSDLDLANIELANTRIYLSMYLLLPYEAFRILPIVLRGVLAHKRHFSYMSCRGDLTTTFIPENAQIESMVSLECPYVRKGILLDIFIPDELREQILEKIENDINGEHQLNLPKTYEWPDYKFHITVVDEKEFPV